mmetsp:Transcript_8306/g.30662  ORF Transcript_8306/g.30662 Transcript_8306/m.30662 type:complete len:247 (-) Transcript_8306:581-1321(-)
MRSKSLSNDVQTSTESVWERNVELVTSRFRRASVAKPFASLGSACVSIEEVCASVSDGIIHNGARNASNTVPLASVVLTAHVVAEQIVTHVDCAYHTKTTVDASYSLQEARWHMRRPTRHKSTMHLIQIEIDLYRATFVAGVVPLTSSAYLGALIIGEVVANVLGVVQMTVHLPAGHLYHCCGCRKGVQAVIVAPVAKIGELANSPSISRAGIEGNETSLVVKRCKSMRTQSTNCKSSSSRSLCSL